MSKTLLRHALLTSVIASSAALAQATRQPLSYTIRIPDPASKTFVVDMAVPSEGRDSVILMMPIWSPGMYMLQSYGDRVTAISAKAAEGAALDVDRLLLEEGGHQRRALAGLADDPRGAHWGPSTWRPCW